MSDSSVGRGPLVDRVSIALLVVITVTVALRFVARFVTRVKFGWDDIFTVAGWFFFIWLCIINIIAVHFGLGRKGSDPNPTDATRMNEAAWFLGLDYSLANWAIKMSVLFTNIRYFGLYKKWFKIAVFSLMFYVCAWGISGFIMSFVQCRPIDYFWTQFRDPPGEGTCPLNNKAIVIAFAALNTAADFALLFLPLPILWGLHLPNLKKFGLMSIFCIYILACIAGIARLVSTLNNYVQGTDEDYNMALVFIWTSVEAGVQLFCTCLPLIGPLSSMTYKKASSTLSSRFSQRSLLNSKEKDSLDSNSRNSGQS